MTAQQKTYKKKKLGGYPYGTVLFSVIISLFIVGILGAFQIHINGLIKNVKGDVQVDIQLNNHIPEAQAKQLVEILESKPYINSDNKIVYISKEEHTHQEIEKTGHDFMEVLDDSPIRAIIRVKINHEFATKNHLKKIKTELEGFREVYEVPISQFQEDAIGEMNKVFNIINIILLCFITFSVFIIAILINNTIRLSLFSQRFLIRSMQLVGATSTFIQLPFIRRSIYIGIIGGLVAAGLCFLTVHYTQGLFFDVYQLNLKEVNNLDHTLIVLAALPLIGIFIGVISSYRAVNRYLRLSLDELY